MYIGLFSLFIGYLFYRVSSPIAKSYTQRYCGVYDMYRFEFLKKLKVELPQNSYEEPVIWKKVSEFLAVGTYFGDLYFDYIHDPLEIGGSSEVNVKSN